MNEQIMVLIDICPGIRLPQYEQEIFSCDELTNHYLSKLCEQYWWYSKTSRVCNTYFYARYIIKGRWPEAEAIIARGESYYRRSYNFRFGANI
jgi:hypothetical protein